MRTILRKLFSFILAGVLVGSMLIIGSGVINAQAQSEKMIQLQKEIEQYENELNRLKSQASTLSNQIAQYDAQIKLATLKISETQEKIDQLSGRIGQLEMSLGSLTQAFSSRAVEVYKMARTNKLIAFLMSAPDLGSAVTRYSYLKKIQEADRDLLLRLQSAQTTYQGEKEDQLKLQETLEIQKKSLDSQKKVKADLLLVTKNDEKKYQQLLAQAKSEYEAIQAIVAGKGVEEEAGKVNQGSRIASIIQGSSCNSSGTHLHFIVKQGSSVFNPFSYLSSSVSSENCSGSSCGSGDGDPFNPSGSWDWPISSPIEFSQGYGATWAIRNTWVGRIYSFHNGIDINSGNSEVRAVKGGTLYRGSYGGSGGCRLRYVRIDHDDSDLETLYLHINY